MTDVNYTPDFDPVNVDGDYGSTGGDITVPTFHDIKPFRFWCQKALPLVYDDSLSYYEVLCKVVNYLNNMMTDLTTGTGAITQFANQFVINQQFLNNMAEKLGENTEELEDYINDRMGDFTDAYNELQVYVNQYFNNLDVQDEIDTKLDEMAESGQFNVLFDPVIQAWMEEETEYINTSIANQNSTLAQQNGRISTLEGRMDTFASLPSGSTSGNAELLDIRTNFLGETFGTAGDAVRTSDLVASGYTPLAITSSMYDGQPTGIGWFDVTKYKGGRIAFIANIQYNSIIWSNLNNILLKVSDTNNGVYDGHYMTPDDESEYYYGNFIEEFFEKQLAVYVTSQTDPMYNSSRVLCIFKLKENFPYKYIGVNFSNESDVTTPLVPIIRPDLISYGTYWLETPIDPTLSVSGEAADAKATGDALSDAKDDFFNQLQPNYRIVATKAPSANTNGEYIPFIANNGDSITAYTADGNNFDQVQLRFYDADKQYIEYWSLHSAYGNTRTFTYNKETAYYVSVHTVLTSSPDDYVIINNSNPYLQKITEIESVESNHATKLTEHTELIELITKGYITQQTETGYAFKNNVNVGSVVNIDTPTADENTASLVVKNVTEGMRFKVFGGGQYNYLLWSWLDKDRKLISKASTWESSGANGVIITAPSNAVYLVCCSSIPYTYGFSAQYLGATVMLDNEISSLMSEFDITKTNANLLKNADFSFSFFSDIHGGDVNFQHIIQHAEDNNLDVIINGGDTVLRYLDDQEYSIDWYATDVNSSTVDILSAVGNHDVWTGAYWTKAEATDIYNTFIKPLVSKFTGIVQPASAEANGLCYYYKDYGSIRVIIINAMSGAQSVDFWDTAQATWFENVLADAKTNSKHVIVCNHSPFPKNIALRDEKSNWNSWIDYRTDASSDSIVINTAALDLIKAFIDAGGIFICLLTGHEHVDSILTATGYDRQFMINIASARWSNHADGITYSSPTSPYYDCFNYCTVDSAHGILKLVRVGWNMDEALKERAVLSYDYFNHKLINE